MADEQFPAPAPQSSTGFSASAERTPPADSNGELPSRNGEAPAGGPATAVRMPEIVKLLRMMLGYLIVAACGWGLLGLIFYLVHSSPRSTVFLGVAAALDLILFLFLEKDFRLSRFMGLRIEPGGHPWHSAILLWLLGVPGLLFRSTEPQPQAEAAGRTAARTRPRPQQMPPSDSFREIVETIVFVVVLVLLLKSFAAEAFVIPTGSMAQTLLGYQKEVECPDCGLKFPINCSQEVDPNEGKPSPVYACICPNCRQHIHFRNAVSSLYDSQFPESMAVDDPGWNSGDRVLVAKFVYDLFDKLPNRLDVVVFKFPGNPDFPASGPYKNHVPMNYIKRLIGLPGETIAIQGGNLYFLSPDKGPHYGDYEKAKSDPEMRATLWKKEWMHVNEARELFAQGQFQIIKKNPENILSMMRLVYDNDHPSVKTKQPARWTGDGGWTEHAPHGFRGEGGNPNEPHWLTYRNLLREDNGNPSLIMDFMGYNTYQTQHHQPLPGVNWVGDLILECEADIENPTGELMLELSKGVDRFQARWDLATGVCTLLRLHDGIEEKLESKPTAVSKKGNYRLRFANVDERLTVWVNGELPFDSGVSYSPPKSIAPTEENDLKHPARIGLRGSSAAVHKLKLFRDTYYTVGGSETDNDPRAADVGSVEPTNPESWHKLENPPVLTLYVQPDHFLCLGDNSPESSDGRAWGAVPRRLLLGRALLVYYPFGRAGRIR